MCSGRIEDMIGGICRPVRVFCHCGRELVGMIQGSRGVSSLYICPS